MNFVVSQQHLKEKLQNTESTPTSTPINALSALGSYDSDSNSEEDS